MTNTPVQCDACGLVFIPGWSEEEARAESDRLWTKEEQADGMSLICHDCHIKLMDILGRQGE